MLILGGRKSFKIGLAVLIQYRRVTDSQPASQPRYRSKYAICISASRSKNAPCGHKGPRTWRDRHICGPEWQKVGRQRPTLFSSFRRLWSDVLGRHKFRLVLLMRSDISGNLRQLSSENEQPSQVCTHYTAVIWPTSMSYALTCLHIVKPCLLRPIRLDSTGPVEL